MCPVARPPGFHALYTELGRTLPVFDGCCLSLHHARSFSTALERGALTEGWGPRPVSFTFQLAQIPPWPQGPALPSPCPLGDTGAGVHMASVGLGTFTNVRT